MKALLSALTVTRCRSKKVQSKASTTCDISCDMDVPLIKRLSVLTTAQVVLEFAIRDTGIGVKKQMADCLFEPFVQEDGSFRRKYGGTGLGLSIVKNLVALMGGQVHLSSVVGQGTTFTFQIVVGIADTIVESGPLPASVVIGPRQGQQLRMLVVEDEKINAMVISAMLGKLGHAVELVGNGREALEKICDYTFDCIFMDIQMPEMDGVKNSSRRAWMIILPNQLAWTSWWLS